MYIFTRKESSLAISLNPGYAPMWSDVMEITEKGRNGKFLPKKERSALIRFSFPRNVGGNLDKIEVIDIEFYPYRNVKTQIVAMRCRNEWIRDETEREKLQKKKISVSFKSYSRLVPVK